MRKPIEWMNSFDQVASKFDRVKEKKNQWTQLERQLNRIYPNLKQFNKIKKVEYNRISKSDILNYLNTELKYLEEDREWAEEISQCLMAKNC